MSPRKIDSGSSAGASRHIEREIHAFSRTSSSNRLPGTDNLHIFDRPVVHYADGDDPIFAEYRTVIAPTHLTPREALAKALDKSTDDIPSPLSVISWVLPVTAGTRRSNRRQTGTPSRLWALTRWYGEKFNDALRQHVVEILTGMGYMAAAPMLQPYFKIERNQKGPYSNWSERHIAYAAGLGTFSLSDGFITERGIAHRCGSVVTDLVLLPSPRTAENHYSNCLYYVDVSCKSCIRRCPAGAITENGHDKVKCNAYIRNELAYLLKEYDVGTTGCGLCQTKVPCEFRNPTASKK